jgi:hypothetical protein
MPTPINAYDHLEGAICRNGDIDDGIDVGTHTVYVDTDDDTLRDIALDLKAEALDAGYELEETLGLLESLRAELRGMTDD